MRPTKGETGETFQCSLEPVFEPVCLMEILVSPPYSHVRIRAELSGRIETRDSARTLRPPQSLIQIRPHQENANRGRLLGR